MKKKNYIAPEMKVVYLDSTVHLLAGSISASSYDIGYGGVDESGIYDPD